MPHATRPGDVLADRYRLVDLLSESGDGRFWRAHDRILERHVAVHVIRADDERAEALMAAARRSATVLDPRILRVLDADVTDQVCYVVNEWGWGASLDIVAAGTGPIGPRRAAWLVSEVADSIATAHRAGVTHGRLNPENVLIDRTGGVRIIGLCVDAALHGLPEVEPRDDVADLAGLLYCALTARWGGRAGSIVTPAPREHGDVLRPRRVRAGIPRPLDNLCDEILHSHPHARHREPDGLPTDAQGIAHYLADFVGDPTGMALALLASAPPVLPDEELVVLPQVPELTPHDLVDSSSADSGARGSTASRAPIADQPTQATPATPAPPAPPDASEPEVPETDASGAPDAHGGPDRGTTPPAADADAQEHDVSPDADAGSDADAEAARAPADHELPTQAGMPIFGPDGDDVSWLERRTTPAPPPPPFDSPPERPLFAPEPEGDAPARRTRHTGPVPTPTQGSPSAQARPREGYWPWDTSAGASGVGTGLVDGRGLSSSTILPVVEDDRVPGRSWFRLGAVLSVVVLVVVAVLVAISLNQDPAGDGDAQAATPSGTGAARVDSAPLDGVTATAFDPLGTDGFENDDQAAAAVDGDDATTWDTQSYNDQLGPPLGLKTGVGLLLDLGGPQAVTEADLTLVGAPTTVALYLFDEAPTSVADARPVAERRTERERLRLRLDAPVEASYAVVWLTELPAAGSLFRGSVAEVVVRAATEP